MLTLCLPSGTKRKPTVSSRTGMTSLICGGRREMIEAGGVLAGPVRIKRCIVSSDQNLGEKNQCHNLGGPPSQ